MWCLKRLMKLGGFPPCGVAALAAWTAVRVEHILEVLSAQLATCYAGPLTALSSSTILSSQRVTSVAPLTSQVAGPANFRKYNYDLDEVPKDKGAVLKRIALCNGDYCMLTRFGKPFVFVLC